MSAWCCVFLFDNPTSVKANLLAMATEAEGWKARGLIDHIVKPLHVIKCNNESRDGLEAFLKDEDADPDAQHTPEYRAEIRELMASIETKLTFQLSNKDDNCAQWVYLLDQYPDAIVQEGPLGHEISFAKDIIEEYRAAADVDLSNPQAKRSKKAVVEDSAPTPAEIPDPTRAVYINETLLLLQHVQESPKRISAFQNFLARANKDQKTYIESVLRKTVADDKAAQTLLRMERIAYLHFTRNLREKLSSLG